MRQSKNYEKDFYKWAISQADLLKRKEFSKLDLKNIAEEIESLGKSDKRSLKSKLVVLLQHLLKNTYALEQKGNSKSWDATILNCRNDIKFLLEDSPSLKNELKKVYEACYKLARENALTETGIMFESKFPLKCPWKLKEILGE